MAIPEQLLLLLQKLSLEECDFLAVSVAEAPQRVFVTLIQTVEEHSLPVGLLQLLLLPLDAEHVLALLFGQQVRFLFQQSHLLLQTVAEQFQLSFLFINPKNQ